MVYNRITQAISIEEEHSYNMYSPTKGRDSDKFGRFI